MIYLINIILFLLISFTANANQNNINEILFKINNKVFTNIDLEQRTEYVALLNNFNALEFSVSENDEILNDYISSLIFYEYYVQNRIIYKNIKDEIELLYKKNLKDNTQLNKEEIKNFKFNIYLDLIRNKIIEENLNSRKDTLLEEVPVPQVKKETVLIKTTKTLVSLGTEKMLVDFGKANLIQKAKQQPDKVKMVLDKVKTDGLRPTLEAVFNKLGQPLPLGYCNVGKVVAVGKGVTEFSIGDRELHQMEITQNLFVFPKI